MLNPDRLTNVAEMFAVQKMSNIVFARLADSLRNATFDGALGFVGFGVDLCSIPEMAEALGDRGFADRYFTEKERAHNGRLAERYATNFAIKEALIKSTKTWPDYLVEIEVLHETSGAPFINLSGSAQRMTDALGIEQFLISATHEGDLAFAACFGFGKKRHII